MNNKTQEALNLCLRVLRPIAEDKVYETRWLQDAIDATELALMSQEQEPVGIVYNMQDGYVGQMVVKDIPHKTLLYTHPAQPLSDDELMKTIEACEDKLGRHLIGAIMVARAIEKAHHIGVKDE